MKKVQQTMKDQGLDIDQIRNSMDYYLTPADLAGEIKQPSKTGLAFEILTACFLFSIFAVSFSGIFYGLLIREHGTTIALSVVNLAILSKGGVWGIATARGFGAYHNYVLYSYLSQLNIGKLEWVQNQETIKTKMPARVLKSAIYWQNNYKQFKIYVGC